MPTIRAIAELDTGGAHNIGAMADDTTILHSALMPTCKSSSDGLNFCSVTPEWAKGGGGNFSGQGQVFPTG
jgi:hypothetical protein